MTIYQKILRTIIYIDGFNLYYGLRSKGWRKYYWLNLRCLSQKILKLDQRLIATKYFTARVSAGNKATSDNVREKMESKRRRQAIYLDALGGLNNFMIFEGHFLAKTITCKTCGYSWLTHEEKMTDVNIATELIMDAHNDNFDVAMIISGDSDLVPPILAVQNTYPEKRIVVAFLPSRSSERLKQTANAFFTIGEANIRQSQFPEEIRRAEGIILKRPEKWR